jgi:hypothetical protein
MNWSCEGCFHALFNDVEQVGCKHDLHHKLGYKKLEDEIYYSLNRICLQKNKKDADIKFGYLFILESRHLLPVLIEKIGEAKETNPCWIGVSTLFNDTLKDIKETIGPDIKNNIIINTENYSDYYKLDQFIKDYQNGWTYVHKIGEPYRRNARQTVESFILEKAGRVAMIADEEEAINDICFYNYIYRALKGNKPEIDPAEGIAKYKSLYHKIEELSPEMIKRWADL